MPRKNKKPVIVPPVPPAAPVESVSVDDTFVPYREKNRLWGCRLGDMRWQTEHLVEFFTQSGCFNVTDYKPFYMTTYSANARVHLISLIKALDVLMHLDLIDCYYATGGNYPTPMNVLMVKLTDSIYEVNINV